MVSLYHELATEFIEEYCKKFIEEGKIRTISKGGIPLNHLSSQFIRIMGYIPDVYFFRDKDMKLVTFQVLDSQAKDVKKILGDVLNAILSANVEVAYFILPEKIDYKKIKDMMKVVENRLVDLLQIPKKNLPKLVVILIPRSYLGRNITLTFPGPERIVEWSNPKLLNDIFNNAKRKEGWFI